MCLHTIVTGIMSIVFLSLFIFVFITDYIEINFQKHKIKSGDEEYKI
jgi:hypothetical protein